MKNFYAFYFLLSTIFFLWLSIFEKDYTIAFLDIVECLFVGFFFGTTPFLYGAIKSPKNKAKFFFVWGVIIQISILVFSGTQTFQINPLMFCTIGIGAQLLFVYALLAKFKVSIISNKTIAN